MIRRILPLLLFIASPAVAQTSTAWRGMALPVRQVTLNAPMDGILASIAIAEGQHVHAGDLLISMDDTVQQAVVKAARLRAAADAEQQNAKLQLEEAKITLERMIEAQKNRAAQEWEIRRATLQRDIAAVAVAKTDEDRKIAEAELELEQQRLDHYRLTAPWDGIVVRLPVKAGSTVSRSDPVLKLVALDQLEAEIYLPAEQCGRVKVGSTYSLSAGAPVNRDLPAKLKFADPMIDPASQTFRCVFVIDNPDQSLPAGFVVQLAESSIK